MIFSESLKKNSDFRTVYSRGTSAANKYLVMYVKRNDLGKNRVGISVSKKVGNSVVRHRLTRLIREAYRLRETDFSKGFDVVVIARAAAKGNTQDKISRALYHLGHVHHILGDPHETCDD